MDLSHEIFYNSNYENLQRKTFYARLKWLDFMAFLFSFLSSTFYIA